MVDIVETIVVDCQYSVFVLLELHIQLSLLTLKHSMGCNAYVISVQFVVVRSISCIFALIFCLVGQQQGDLIDEISDKPAVLLGSDEVRVDSWVNPHISLHLILGIDPFLNGR